MSSTNIVCAITVAALALAAPAPAIAAELLFEFDLPGWQTQFTLDSNPIPTIVGDHYFFFQFHAADVNGVSSTTNIQFYDATYWGGANFGLGSFTNSSDNRLLKGSTLFGGTLSEPTFAPGLFSIENYGTGSVGTLKTSEVLSPVPEPSTWATMILGFGLIGGAMRARRRQRVTFRLA